MITYNRKPLTVHLVMSRSSLKLVIRKKTGVSKKLVGIDAADVKKVSTASASALWKNDVTAFQGCLSGSWAQLPFPFRLKPVEQDSNGLGQRSFDGRVSPPPKLAFERWVVLDRTRLIQPNFYQRDSKNKMYYRAPRILQLFNPMLN